MRSRLLCERFSLDMEDTHKEKLKAARRVMAAAMCTVTEAVLVSILEEKSLTVEIKRSKLKKQFDKVASASQKLSADIKKLMHARIVKESCAKLLS